MAITKDQVLSYGVSGGTATTGWVAQKVTETEQASVDWASSMAADVAAWAAMDYLTASCMILGAIGVVHRIFVDWSAHRDRKRRIQHLQDTYQWPTK